MSVSAIACFLVLIAVQHTCPTPLKDISFLNSWLGKHPELREFSRNCVLAATPFPNRMEGGTFSAENFTLASAEVSDIVMHTPLTLAIKFEGIYKSTLSDQELSNATASLAGQVTINPKSYHYRKLHENYYSTYAFFSLEEKHTFNCLVEALEPYKKSIYEVSFSLKQIPVSDDQYIQMRKISVLDTNPYGLPNEVNFFHVIGAYENTNTNQDFYVRYAIELSAADLQRRGEISFS